jgi:hypothetical protein
VRQYLEALGWREIHYFEKYATGLILQALWQAMQWMASSLFLNASQTFLYLKSYSISARLMSILCSHAVYHW